MKATRNTDGTIHSGSMAIPTGSPGEQLKAAGSGKIKPKKIHTQSTKWNQGTGGGSGSKG